MRIMLTKARQAIKRWRLAHLNRQIAKISGSSWVLPYIDEYGHRTPCVSTKPLFFTNAESLKAFVDEVAHGQGRPQYTALINSTFEEHLTEHEQLERFINAAPGSRTRLQIDFSGHTTQHDSSPEHLTITFASKTRFEKAHTEITGTQDKQLGMIIMAACDRQAKPIGPIQRHRTIPMVEPIDAKEESDRRNRWETNWKNILVSAMAGLISGTLPMLVRAILHI